MNNHTQITIYIDKLSPFSRQLQNDLQQVGIEPEIKKVDEDMDAAIEMYKLAKTNRVPIITVTTQHETVTLIGYTQKNKQTLASLLQITLPD